jgi:hypothetical protein
MLSAGATTTPFGVSLLIPIDAQLYAAVLGRS